MILVALAVAPAQSSEPVIIPAKNENVLYPQIEEELPKLPIAQDKPKNIGGSRSYLKYYQKSILPDWDNGLPVWPIYITQSFHRFHPAIDLNCVTGDPVYSAHDGIIIFIGQNKGYGQQIQIKHQDNWETWYSHLSEIFVKKNERVKRGQIIGSCGNTGYSTGSHLDWRVIKDGQFLNPFKYVSS